VFVVCDLQELGLDAEITAMACQAAEILMIMRQVRSVINIQLVNMFFTDDSVTPVTADNLVATPVLWSATCGRSC
jgi:hypothetical protein